MKILYLGFTNKILLGEKEVDGGNYLTFDVLGVKIYWAKQN